MRSDEAYFTLRDIRRTLAAASPRAGLEGAIYAGLERLVEAKLGREWKRDDGAMVRIDRCLIDANWGQSSDVVYQFCRQSRCANAVMPSHGRYAGASSIPFSEYKRKRGDRVGLNWRIDNHWLDCLVGCSVAASMQGAVLYGTDTLPAPRRRIRLSELQGGRR